MTLEISLVELVPTEPLLNAAVDIGALVVPGSKAIEEAAVVGAQAGGAAIASGSIAIEMKLTDSNTGKVLAEMKDRQSDPASIIPNVRDFERLGWSRKEIEDWSHQFVEVFSTEKSEAIAPSSGISLLPW